MNVRATAVGLALLTMGFAGRARAEDRPSEQDIFGGGAAATPRRAQRTGRADSHDRAAVSRHRRAGAAVARRLPAARRRARLRGRRRHRARSGAAERRQRRQVPLRLRGAREPAADRRPALSAHADHRLGRSGPALLVARRAQPARPLPRRASESARPRVHSRSHELRPDAAAEHPVPSTGQGRLERRVHQRGQPHRLLDLQQHARAGHVARPDVDPVRHPRSRLRDGRQAARALGHRAVLAADRLPAPGEAQPARRVRRASRDDDAEAERPLGGQGVELLRVPDRRRSQRPHADASRTWPAPSASRRSSAGVELGADTYLRRGQKPRFGFDLSTGIYDFDVYADVAVRPGGDFLHEFPAEGTMPAGLYQLHRLRDAGGGRDQLLAQVQRQRRLDRRRRVLLQPPGLRQRLGLPGAAGRPPSSAATPSAFPFFYRRASSTGPST